MLQQVASELQIIHQMNQPTNDRGNHYSVQDPTSPIEHWLRLDHHYASVNLVHLVNQHEWVLGAYMFQGLLGRVLHCKNEKCPQHPIEHRVHTPNINSLMALDLGHVHQSTHRESEELPVETVQSTC